MQLIKFFVLFKLHSQQKKHMFKIRYNRKHTPLIKLFIQFKLIKQIFHDNRNWFIWPNNSRETSFITNLKLLYKPSHRRYVNIETLKKMEGTAYASIYIISSHKGLITNITARKKNVGGIFFFILS